MTDQKTQPKPQPLTPNSLINADTQLITHKGQPHHITQDRPSNQPLKNYRITRP